MFQKISIVVLSLYFLGGATVTLAEGAPRLTILEIRRDNDPSSPVTKIQVDLSMMGRSGERRYDLSDMLRKNHYFYELFRIATFDPTTLQGSIDYSTASRDEIEHRTRFERYDFHYPDYARDGVDPSRVARFQGFLKQRLEGQVQDLAAKAFELFSAVSRCVNEGVMDANAAGTIQCRSSAAQPLADLMHNRFRPSTGSSFKDPSRATFQPDSEWLQQFDHMHFGLLRPYEGPSLMDVAAPEGWGYDFSHTSIDWQEIKFGRGAFSSQIENTSIGAAMGFARVKCISAPGILWRLNYSEYGCEVEFLPAAQPK